MRQNPTLLAIALLFVLTLATFFDLLLGANTQVVGNQTGDLFNQFIAWRDFGFRELAHGNLALWNPNVYSGAPYFGGFQAALLYPPNWLFLILPLSAAINWSIALHVFAIGAFMYLWMARRGLHPAAAFLAGTLVMFSGAHFLHIYAGHLPNLCTMVWAPLIFLAIDDLTTTRSLRGAWIGAGAVAMQILAGHPQYVFYTAIIVGIYSLLCLWKAPSKWNAIGGYALICLGGAALSAAQLLTGMQAANESIRQELGRQMASSFSFAPENLL